MIDRLYKFIQTVSNNELNGNISPQEFKLLLHSSVLERYEENIYELNRILNRERRGMVNHFSIENLTGKIRQRILHYYAPTALTETEGNGLFTLPSDLRYLDTVEVNGYDAEPMQNRRHFKAVTSLQDTMPKATTPIYHVANNKLEIAPIQTTPSVQVYYLRNPKIGNWTYALLPNQKDPSVFIESFDPSAPDFQDVDAHSSEEYNLSIKLLQRLGINLNQEQLTQYGIAKENMDSQQEISN